MTSVKMFSIFKLSARVEDLEKALRQLQQELKYYKDEFDKLEIKALESRKLYHKKLKQAFGDDSSSLPSSPFLIE